LKNWQDRKHLKSLSDKEKNLILSQQTQFGIPRTDFSFHEHEGGEEETSEGESREDERRRKLAYRIRAS
jgi:hypothetical protein